MKNQPASPLMSAMRRHNKALTGMVCAITAAWQVAQPVMGADIFWTAGSGANFQWDTAANWGGTAPTLADSAILPFAVPNPGALPNPSILILGASSQAGSVEFRNNYLLAAGTLTLGAGGLAADLGTHSVINSVITGTNGLLKTGGGAVRLENPGNNYTGATTITNGSLIISSVDALGDDNSTVVVSGSATRGFGGGQLVLEGGYSSGVDFNRDLSLQGYGPLSDRSGALASVGANTLSGAISTGVGLVNTRVNSIGGLLTISGPLTVLGTAGTTISTFGTVNSAGIGNTSITGVLTGTGTIDHLGSGTLILSPSSATGFTGSIRVSSSAAGGVSTVRATSPADFGAGTGTDSLATLDLNGGTLEIRSDLGAFNKNVYNRASSTLFVDHAIGSQAINNTITLGNYRLSTTDAQTGTFAGRNGTNVTFTGNVTPQTAGSSQVITNNMNGILTFGGTVAWGTSDGTARTLTVQGTGNTVISGNLLATPGAAHIFTKSNAGTVTLNGAASTYTGATNITAGTLQIAHFGSINNNTAAVNIGSTTTGATLSIIGSNLTTAQATTSKVINLAGTTGGATILANQTGTSPALIFSAAFTAGGAGAKTLTLGGSSTLDNIINGAIVENNTTAVTKTGPGTWVLAGVNAYTAATTINEGTLKIKANAASSTIINDASAITFNSNATTGSAGGILQFTGISGSATTETLGALTPTAGAGTVTLTSGGAGAAANLNFTSLAATTAASSVNFITTGAAGGLVTLTGQAATTATDLPGTANFRGHLYLNGSNFAIINGSAQVVAPTYTTTAGDPFRQASSALVASVHNELTGSFSSAAATISSLKLTTQTLTLSAGLTVNLGALLQTGGTATIQSNNATARTIVGSAAGVNVAIRVDGASDVLNLGADGFPVNISSTTTAGFTKNGAGTLVINGVNAQTGTTTINEGTVRLGANSARLSGNNVALVIRQGGVLDLNGQSSGQAIAALDGAGTITNSSSSAATLIVGNVTTGAGTFAGIIEDGVGVMNVSVTGTTGSPTWSGLNTYTGVTTIGTGLTTTAKLVNVTTLANIGTASSIGRGNASNNAGSLVFGGLSTAGIAYTGTTSVSTNRLFTLNGGFAGAGAQIANNSSTLSALIFSNTNPIVFGAGATVEQTLTLGGSSTADNYFNPRIVNNGSLATSVSKIGASVWFLGNSSNSYTGTTTVTAGALGAVSGSGLPANSPLVLNGGQLLSSGNFTRSLVATATPGNADEVTWSAGGGFAAYDEKLVVAIGGLSTPTELTWGTGGFVPTGNLILNSSTALSEVEFRNAINLGAAARTIQVDDNGTTNTDFATITGVISGAADGNLLKTGTGQLQLLGANTYLGTTEVQAGTLIVRSLGSSTVSGGSNVGQTGITMDNSNAIVLGTAAVAGLLQYIGAGETSDRKIRLNGTTANNQIHADGSGPLILTNVAHDTTATGNKTLSLRGSNTAGNMITSNLSDNGAGVLSVTVDGGATWILTGTNTYTGTTTVSAGALGIGSAGSIPAALTLNSGNLFAYGADLTLNNVVNGANNTSTGIIGEYSLTFTQPLTIQAGANNYGMNNNLASGKMIEFAGATANSLTANRTWTIDGSGTTIVNGNITTSTAFGLAITKNGNGVLALGGTGTSNYNQNNALTTVSRGTLRFLAGSAIRSNAGDGGLTLSPTAALGSTAILDLNGTAQTINAFTGITDGTIIINNTSASAATFRFGANNSTVNFGSGAGNYSIQNTGTGALSLVKLGNTSTTFNSGVTVGNKGTLASEGGGSFIIAGPVSAASGLRAIEASLLALTGGITNPGLITSINVGGGSTLNLLDGAGSAITNLTSLSLGNTGTGTVTLNLNVGDLDTAGDNGGTDRLRLLTGGTQNLGNTITFNMTDAGLNPNQTYTLLNLVDGGLTAFGVGNLIQGATPGGFTSMTWNVTDNLVQLTTGNLIVGDIYWRGLTNTTWNGNANNWSTDKAGATPAASIPGQGNTVRFAYNGVGTAALTTTLEQNFKVNALVFESGTTTPASVTINPGAVPTARLEVAPQNSADGVSISTGGPAAVTIASNFRLGANQTWNVTDAATTLTLSGTLFGERNVTKSGAGRVVLSGTPDSTFNAGKTATFTVAGGNLELTNISALGTLANDNRASVVASGGGFYVNNATASTFTNAVTLSGGALSAGGNTQTYSSTVNVTAASTINMADSNGPVTNTARSITLSGGLTGSGNLTVTGNNTVSGGNQIGGTLTLNQDNSAWSGSWNILRGSIATNNVNGLGSGASITAEKGRIQFTGTVGARTLSHAITVASSTENAILELNQAAGIAFTYSGLVTLGGTGGSGELRVFMTDDAATATLTGGVVLANNGGLSTQNAATRVLVVDSVVSQTGGARTLTINDAAWGGTGGTVRLNMANTYTGGTILSRGILQLGNVSALSTGAVTAQGASTLNSLVDLTGANALANALNLNAVLTFTGLNGFTFTGTTSNVGAGGVTNSLTEGSLLFSQVNLSDGTASAARTLTIAGASTGGTTITALLNNNFSNTLTNNLSAHTLSIGSIALSEASGAGRTLTLGGTGNTTVTGVIENILGGGGLAGALTKAGTGTLNLQGANTFTGAVTVTAGVLQFSTVTDSGGAASNLGQGTSISLGGGTLSFIGSSSQATNRAVSTTASSTLAANGTGGAIIRYNGAITQAADNTLTLTGTAEGIIAGGITQPAGAASADLSVTSGNWTVQDGNASVADDLLVTGGSLTLKDMVLTLNDDVVVTGGVLNLNSAGVIVATSPAGTSSGLHVRNGGVINLNANGAWADGAVGGLDFINVGDATAGTAGVLNTNTFNLSSPGLLVGGIAAGLEGSVTGSGTITVTSTATDWSLGIRTYRGSISANLAGVASLLKQGLGEVTLSGNNSGLTGTVAATRIDAGSLVLDYSTQNNAKISSTAQLDMRGGSITLVGNGSAATVQSVGSFTLANASGANKITLVTSGGQDLLFNLGAMTRAVNSQDGTLRIVLPSGVQSATNGVTTTTALTNGVVGGNAYLTVQDSSGTWFASKSGNNIVPLASTVSNTVSGWLTGDHVTDGGAGYTGTYASVGINSLRYDAAGGSNISLGSGVLGITTGGVLVTSNVGGTPRLLGGTVFSGSQASNVPELIITHDGATVFELGSSIRTNSAFTKTGPGTLRLSGVNTATGTVEIQQGVLQLAGGNALSDTALVSLSDDIESGLELLASETVGRLSGGSATDGLRSLATIAVGAHTLTTNQTASTTYAGLFTGTGTIVMNAGNTGNLNVTNISPDFTGSVVVNGGLFQLSGIGQINASNFTVNKSGSLLLDNNGTTRSGTRILDTANITLNSADGVFSGETIVRGLAIRTNQNASTNETIGVLTFNSGASYLTGEASGTTGNAQIITSNFVRSNNATVMARGRALGLTTGDRNQFRISDATNQTAFIGTLVGGAGAAGSPTLSIVPWAIGENITAITAAATNMGNSLVTYVSGAGFRPLDLTTEYAAYATAGATNNTRESLTADLTGLAGRTLNSLVIHNNNTSASTINVTGSGAGQSLVNTSGAFLFTLNTGAAASSAHVVNLGGYDSGISVGGSEYLFYVVNPSFVATTATLSTAIASNLTSSADITKSGRGTLVLSGANTAGGGSRRTTLNEGVLEIGALSNIGGSTGNLVFAGGTLRLGSGFADDISSRTISYLIGGGTLDTNGIDLALGGSLGSGVGGFTKTGAGNLTLNAASTFTGGTTVTGGTLTVGANNATGNGGSLTIAGGATLDVGTRSISHTLVTTSGASPAVTGTGTISASSGFFLNHTVDTTIDAVLAGAGGLLKAQANIVTLTGSSTYAGITEVQAGTLSFNSIGNVGGGASALGAPATVEAGIIRLGLTTVAATLQYTGGGHSSNRLIALQGTTGGATLNANGTGALNLAGGARTENAGAKTLTLGGSSEAAIINSIGLIQEVGAVVTLLKTDANTWAFTASNSYTGATSINNGILRLSAAQILAGALNFGSASNITTAGRLEVLQDSSFGPLTVQTNSDTNINHLQIASGKTLTINGNAVIGTGVGALSTTRLASSGGGTLAVTNLAASATFRVGGSAANGNVTIADLSGLGALNVSLNTTNGVFRVASTTTQNVSDTYSTLTLPANTTVTAATLSVGDGGQANGSVGQINSLYLGTGSTVFNVGTINIGTTSRDQGRILFSSGTLGSLTIRAADGTGRAVFNMGTGQNTGVAAPETNDFNVSGHSADLLLGVVSIGNSGRGSSYTNSFSFDQGTLDMTSLNLSTRTADTTNGAGLARNTTTTMNLGGGTVNIVSGITAMASQAGAYGTNPAPQMTAVINISGGTVSIGATSGTSITMGATTSTAGTGTPTSTATINITGGAVTMSGNVVRGALSGAGVVNSSIVLNGGSLNMSGNSIGTAASQVALNAQSGTLLGLGQLNGGGALTKTTAGVLVMGNGNAYTGGTSVTGGTLRLANTTGSATGSGALSTSAGTTLTGVGSIVAASGNNVTVGGSLVLGNVGDTSGSQISVTTAGSGLMTLNGDIYFDLFGGYNSGTLNGAASGDRLVVSGANGFSIGSGSNLHISSSAAPDSSWVAGTSWRLFDWGSLTGGVSGSFANLPTNDGNFTFLPDLGSFSLSWDVSQLYTLGTITIVPEPSRALLLLLGLMLGLTRRRRQGGI